MSQGFATQLDNVSVRQSCGDVEIERHTFEGRQEIGSEHGPS